jgi:hypothetical protein
VYNSAGVKPSRRGVWIRGTISPARRSISASRTCDEFVHQQPRKRAIYSVLRFGSETGLRKRPRA